MPFAKNDGEFDDCPICRAQMKADREGRALTMAEFIAASEEAKTAGAVVGSMADLPPYMGPLTKMEFEFDPMYGAADMMRAAFAGDQKSYARRKRDAYAAPQETSATPLIDRPPAEA
jgi:hypothetical protein